MVKLILPLQVLIGILPLLAVSIIVMIKRRKIVVPVIAMAACAVIFTASFFLSDDEETAGPDEEQMAYLANINMLDGDYEQAEVRIEELIQSRGEGSESLRLSFQSSLLQRDFLQAVVRLKALKIVCEDENKELTEFEKAMLEQWDKEGSTGLFAEAAEQAIQQIESSIEAFKKGSPSAEMLEKAVVTANSIDELQKEYIRSGSYDEHQLKKDIAVLLSIFREDESILAIDEVEEALLTGLMMQKDYKDLISYAMESESQNAYVMLGNLIISGEIGEKDFPGGFYDREDYGNVVRRCQNIYSDLDSEDYSNAELSRLRSMVESVKAKNENGLLVALDQAIQPEKAEAGIRSKLYLQNSSITSELKDKEATYDNFSKALESAAFSSDANYKDAMENLGNIINGSADNSEIINMEDYAANAYRESLPVANGDKYTAPESFLNDANTYVNEKRAMINIGIVKTDEFPVVEAYISSGGLDLTDTDNISVTDCNMAVEDFTIEKVNYSASNVYLVCDNSGSMSGDIEQLKQAVRSFVDNQNVKENVGIITFSSYVESSSGLYGIKEKAGLNQYIDGFAASGGTNIGSGVEEALSRLNDSKAFNVIIVMTDGQDSSYGNQSMLNRLTEQCREKNVVLYTIGLGDVNADYLESIAAAGNGIFVYSSNSIQLQELYGFLHNQLDNNYLLRFKAPDTDTNRRTLKVSDTEKGYKDTKNYVLRYEEDEEGNKTEAELFAKNPEKVKPDSISPSTVYMSHSTGAEFFINGTGFDNITGYAVSIYNDSHTVILDKTEKSPDAITVSLPADTQYGTYTVKFVADGTEYLYQIKILEAGKGDKIVFGGYIFKAQSITSSGNTTVLSGNVTLNDYLKFKGDVTLTGDLSGPAITMSDSDGSYVACADGFKGLFKTVFTNIVTLPAFRNFTLYNDEDHIYEPDEYRTEAQDLVSILRYGPLSFATPKLSLNPEYLKLTVMDLTLDIPYLDNLLEYVESPFKIDEINAGILVTPQQFAFKGSFNYEHNKYNNKYALFGFPIKLDKLHVEADTESNDYILELGIGIEGLIPFFGDGDNEESSYGFEIAIKGGNFDTLRLGADAAVTVCATPPVSLSDFKVGVSGLSNSTDNGIGSRLLHATWEGGMDISVCKLKDIIPFLGKLFGDVSLFTFDDTTLKLTPVPFGLEAETTFSLFGEIEIGGAEVNIGRYKYTNPILNINKDVTGFHIGTNTGISWNLNNDIKVKVDGSVAVDINGSFIGGKAQGDVECRFKWLFINLNSDFDGKFIVGLHGDELNQFSIIAKGSDYSGNKTTGFRLTFTKGDWLPDGELY